MSPLGPSIWGFSSCNLPVTQVWNGTVADGGVNPCFESGFLPLVLFGLLFLLVCANIIFASHSRGSAKQGSTSRGFNLHRVFLCLLVATSITGITVSFHTVWFVDFFASAACWVLIWLHSQLLHGWGIFSAPSRYTALPSTFQCWLFLFSITKLLAIRVDLEVLAGNSQNADQRARAFWAAVHTVLCVAFACFSACSRSGESQDFDPRNFVKKPSDREEDEDEDEDDEYADMQRRFDEGLQERPGTVPMASRISSEYGASSWQVLTFSWLTPLLEAGQQAPLRLSQLFLLTGTDCPKANARLIEKAWSAVGKDRPNSLKWAIYRAYFWTIWFNGILQALSLILTLAQPQILNKLLTFIQEPRDDPSDAIWIGYLCAAGLILCELGETIMDNQYYFRMSRLGLRVRGGLSQLIYEKSMKLSQPAQVKIGIGNIVNLMEVDCMKMGWSMYVLHQIWALPAMFIVGMVMLYAQVQGAAFSGLIVMIVLFIPNAYVMKKGVELIKVTFALRDKRVRLLTEYLQGVKLVKMLGWEKLMHSNVQERRAAEVDKIALQRLWWTMVGLIARSTPMLIDVATLVVFILASGKPLTAATGFTVLSLTGIIQTPASGFARTVQMCLDINVSFGRIKRFLLSDEVRESPVGATPPQGGGYYRSDNASALSSSEAKSGDVAGPAVIIRDATFKWASAPKEEEAGSNALDAGKAAAASPHQRGCLQRLLCCCGSARSKKTSQASSSSLAPPQASSPCCCCFGGSKRKRKDKTINSDLQQRLLSVVDAESKLGGSQHNADDGPVADAADGDEASQRPHLHDISLQIPQGSLVFVIGRVGSGKSTLLSGLLNEVPILSGSVSVAGSIAYCSQQAWIQNKTLRANILFGMPFERERYKRACFAADLWKDFEQLEDGDATEIGERGVNLSGGQKQRVSFARAVYSDADIVLLDDVLSAVDVHVGEQIMQEGIVAALRGKTRILVTHAVHWLRYADLIVVMDDGKIKAHGTLDTLQADGFDLSNYTGEHQGEGKQKGQETADTAPPAMLRQATPDGGFGRPATPSGPAGSKSTTKEADSEGEQKSGEKNDSASSKADTVPGPRKPRKLVKKEEQETGIVKFKVWRNLFQGVGNFYCITIFVFVLLIQIAQLGSSWWTKIWVDSASDPHAPPQGFFLTIFAGLAFISVFFNFLRSYLVVKANKKLSMNIHSKALWSVLRSPSAYFDQTRTGRIINRFSSDLSRVDGQVLYSTMWFLVCAFSMLFNLFSVIATAPFALVPCILAAPLFRAYTQQYRESAREVQRISSTTRSPVFSSFTELLGGVSTVRGYGYQQHFSDANERRLILNLSAYYNQSAVSRWLSMRLNTTGAAIFGVVVIFAVLQHHYGWNFSVTKAAGASTISAGIVGLSLNMALSFTGALQGIIQTFTSAETSLVSLERLLSFISLPAEAELVKDTDRQLEANWPTHGHVRFSNVCMRYRPELPMVLNNLDFSISGGKSLGIVGRTGAGKSSILATLFRMVEPSSGVISIDGVDTSTLGLETLRQALAIIPQDPILFSGTLRKNLDPDARYSDNELWIAIRSVELEDYVSSQDDKLEMQISEGGKNLSVGQRQLLCLARALLRGCKVIVLDEATANVDNVTDALIQRTLATKVRELGATVITIAHRINTIIKNDFVMVMEAGRCAEFGESMTLAADPNSLFGVMVRASGIDINNLDEE